ncbi:hypothetical protein FA267_26975 [Pseudomonas aeruginosa]|uniref:hypothetical protein n=1 Tax=Pseudomonas TaxID=286 RepID=UPI000F7E1F3C|nr:hypothetical protein [Pseudomonas aeruginosa]HEK0639915.1 hypothetical protein [Proteus mirabilis]MCO2889553.1 hypothetical protein [Pseudomonas aeruginosa]RTB44057.1 hypothetical protein EJ655_07910 [Pseudomonas aeruginosa]RTB49008.1 hypothetical protein EJ640_22170 [Pseudomonas aeruginosa]RTB87327.1 hypothetical protein EJ641_10350 [Pseudomonas aeruginosa]
MIRHDISHWPLALSLAHGASSLEDIEKFMSAWSDWLAQDESFAILRVFLDSQSTERSAGSENSTKSWLQDQAPRIREQVIGIATVVPPSEYERISKINAERLFGVPAKTFSDVPTALLWLQQEIFNPRGVRFPNGDILKNISLYKAESAEL